MTNSKEDKDKLLKTIRDKRRRIAAYLQEIEPRGSRLTYLSIIFGGIASLLTAAQLVFGRGSANFLKFIYPAGGVSVWQLLAVAATVCSAIAAIAGAIYKQQELASRLAKAQSCAAKLEGLETSLDLELINLKEANTRFTQYIADIPFVPSEVSRVRGTVDSVKGDITSPVALQSVPRAFQASGSATDVGSNIHLWLAVEANALIWPKEGEIFADESGGWAATIFEDGATELFSLSLLAADRRAHKKIEAWLNSGKRSKGKYKELTSLPGTRRVARVDGLRLLQATPNVVEGAASVPGSPG
jgi:hypothetical protein